MKRTGLIFFTVVFVVAIESPAINIQVLGSWIHSFNAGDLMGPPGSDLNPSLESEADQVMLRIWQTHTNWNVDVSRVDANWHGSLRLYVRRTSNGNGPGDIWGGLSYQEVTETDQTFLSGFRQRQNITVQLRLDGISVQLPADTYTTTVYYTIYEW